jgi:hypothetical protein
MSVFSLCPKHDDIVLDNMYDVHGCLCNGDVAVKVQLLSQRTT